MPETAPGADIFYPPVVVTQRRLSLWRWVLPFIAIAILLRLVPIAAGEISAIRSADAQPAAQTTGVANLIEAPGETFPGSAYFFADGAFDPAPGTTVGAANGLDPQWRGNKHILAIDIGPAATPYRFDGKTALDRVRALSCLTNAIYYEAANEPDEGQRAVAQVVLNRLRNPHWPNTICGVVYEGTDRDDLRCQFTFSCDGSMARQPDAARWLRARAVADRALKGDVFAPAGLATYYHTLTVFPGWATQMHASAIIGAHIFYRTPGAGGLPAQFRDAYAGVETISGPSANAYLRPQGESATAPLIPYLPVGTAPLASGTPLPVTITPTLGQTVPVQTMPVATATPMPLPSPSSTSRLPQSGDIRPEYRNSGRPLKK